MLNNVGDIQTQFLITNNRSTTDAFITEATLNNWTRDAHVYAAAYKKWPMTEGKVSTTFASFAVDADGLLAGAYPEGWKSNSVRLLRIGGYQVEKREFYKFMKFLEDNPSDSSRIYSDFGRRIFINPTIDLNGTVTAWGQYMPTLDPTDKTALTIFSGFDEDGNDAIVEIMSMYLKKREHLESEALAHLAEAKTKFDVVWQNIADEKYEYQSTKDEGMFKRIDIINGVMRDDEFNENQFK